jgi:hypothetical protein
VTGVPEHRQLPPIIPTAVRVQLVLVTPSTPGAHRERPHAACLRLFGEHGTDIEVSGARRWAPGDGMQHLRPHLVTAAADGRSKVHGELIGWSTEPRQRLKPARQNASGRPAPPGMEQGTGAARVYQKDRRTIGNGDGERHAVVCRGMAIRPLPP